MGSSRVQFAAIIYGNEASVQFQLNTHNTSKAITDHINSILWLDEKTNTADGLEKARVDVFSGAQSGNRPSAPDIILCITDGNANVRANDTKNQADLARAQGITIFAIGIGDEISNKTLNEIANPSTNPNELFVFSAQNFDALSKIRERVVSAACEIAARK